jgi:multiple antibiotic resistance protein
MDTTFLISAFVTLLVVIDPIGLAPLFVALTTGEDPARRRGFALRACLVAAGVLTIFGIAGESLLGFIGISMSAFRIAGGMLLFLTALEMLFERRGKRRADQTEGESPGGDDPSVFPLAIPLIAGPGAIASMILLTGSVQAQDTATHIAIYGVMLGVVLLVLVLFLLAPLIERALGQTGITVVTRLLGMLLAALSVQFVLDGLRAAGAFG